MNKVVLDETKLRKAMKDALSFDLLVKHTKLRASTIDKALRGTQLDTNMHNKFV